jgi:tRNA threonylcarbamoyladenosine biosynthesis protein TsaB
MRAIATRGCGEEAPVKLLALDSASTACSVAVLVDAAVVAERFEAMARGQAQALMPMIAAAMTAADIPFEALDAVAVTVGPGAFTGVRIGLAAARGLTLARDIPAIGITTLEAVAYPALAELRGGEVLVAAIDSKREEVFVQVFDDSFRALTEPFAATPLEAVSRLPGGSLLLAGDGTEGLRALLGARARLSRSGPPRASAFARLAARRVVPGQATPPRPFYMRPPDARPMPERVGNG